MNNLENHFKFSTTKSIEIITEKSSNTSEGIAWRRHFFSRRHSTPIFMILEFLYHHLHHKLMTTKGFMDKNVVFRKLLVKPKKKGSIHISLCFFSSNYLWLIYFFSGKKIFFPEQKNISLWVYFFYHSQQNLMWFG